MDGGDADAFALQAEKRCGVCGGSTGAESALPLISGSSGRLVGECASPAASPACSNIAGALHACQPAACWRTLASAARCGWRNGRR